MIAWGEPITNNSRKIKGEICLDCYYNYTIEATDPLDFIIGFTDTPPFTSNNPANIFACVYQCPKCKQLFWAHIGKEAVKSLVDRRKWPKNVPLPE